VKCNEDFQKSHLLTHNILS